MSDKEQSQKKEERKKAVLDALEIVAVYGEQDVRKTFDTLATIDDIPYACVIAVIGALSSLAPITRLGYKTNARLVSLYKSFNLESETERTGR